MKDSIKNRMDPAKLSDELWWEINLKPGVRPELRPSIIR